MEPLGQGASLPRIQDYVRRMEAERGLDHQDLTSWCLKLGQEVGKLYGAAQGSPLDPGRRAADVRDKAAAALIPLMAIANRCDINLEDAFRVKENRNESRAWV